MYEFRQGFASKRRGTELEELLRSISVPSWALADPRHWRAAGEADGSPRKAQRLRRGAAASRSKREEEEEARRLYRAERDANPTELEILAAKLRAAEDRRQGNRKRRPQQPGAP